MYDDNEIEFFLKTNNVFYTPVEMPDNVIGFACYKDNRYYVSVNYKHIQNQVELYEKLIIILKNNFIHIGDDREEHQKEIIKIACKLEELCKRR